MGAIAACFDPLSRAFIHRVVTSPVDVAIDLGCGPGHTTKLLAEATQARRVIGVDSAADALAVAERFFPAGEFHQCDVRHAPWPVRPGLAYCRFLLSHLPQPNASVAHWLTQLQPGGLLLLDELHSIEAQHPALRRYLEISYGLVASSGGTMEIGRVLQPPTSARIVSDRVELTDVPEKLAGVWFAYNVRDLWPDKPYVAERLTPDDRSQLLRDLEAIDGPGMAHWRMRRMALIATK